MVTGAASRQFTGSTLPPSRAPTPLKIVLPCQGYVACSGLWKGVVQWSDQVEGHSGSHSHPEGTTPDPPGSALFYRWRDSQISPLLITLLPLTALKQGPPMTSLGKLWTQRNSCVG